MKDELHQFKYVKTNYMRFCAYCDDSLAWGRQTFCTSHGTLIQATIDHFGEEAARTYMYRHKEPYLRDFINKMARVEQRMKKS